MTQSNQILQGPHVPTLRAGPWGGVKNLSRYAYSYHLTRTNADVRSFCGNYVLLVRHLIPQKIS